MKTAYSEQTGKEMYQNLGKLFYAVAMADRAVHISELEKLKSAVRENWLEVDDIEDDYGTDAAFQIEIVFDWLLEYEKSSKESYEEFKTFYKDHQRAFSPKMKQLITRTAHSIAASFAGKNKSELIILAKLDLLLKSDEQDL
ncbi:hypothetical protein [Poritiphilus flavus]|uniref:Co-chaperone DjlA N-terminal domain-containing protein n=1 Tax=Poritiphilus flavus TaxID=2697053 RepID=A0A6L9EB50_9FLAO|nr:hypothetical protein [Poritiphilus flavus]NAS11920.1 hypothetical protein [Poritiphilus flavus]